MSTSSDTNNAVFVYEAPVRLWHWLNALVMLCLFVTGYFIGAPLPSVSGEASDHFLMGYIRFVHFASGYIFIIAFLGRVYWAFAGNHHAREIFIPPMFKKTFWDGVWHSLKWYFFIENQPRKYAGHNPLVVLIMHFIFVWGVIFMMVTGLALYGEGTGLGTWQNTLFSSWVIPLFGQSQDVHTYHRLVMWIMVCFAIAHVYVAIREEIMSRQSILSTMISGWRTFKDNRGKVEEL